MSKVLSSDILERQFGPTEVAVLYQDAAVRIICTKTKRDGQVLEISRVAFDPAGAAAFPAIHQTIAAGESMGKAFRAAGVEFIRETKAAYRQLLPANFCRWFGSHEPATVVVVSILAGPDRTPYAEILETYSPAVQWPQLVGEPAAKDRAAVDRLDAFIAGQS